MKMWADGCVQQPTGPDKNIFCTSKGTPRTKKTMATGETTTRIALPFDALTPPQNLDMDLLDPVLDHMLDLAGGDPSHLEYQLDWWAAVLQKRQKLGVALVSSGKSGVGRGVLVDQLLGRIFGPTFHVKLKGDMLGRVNHNEAVGKLLCLVEEFGCTRKHLERDAFVDVVTSTILRMEPICADPYYVPDARNFVATTTDPHNIKLGRGLDRYTYVTQANSAWAKGGRQEEERLRHFARILGAHRYEDDAPARPATDEEIDAVARQLYWFLMRRNITDFVPQNFPIL